MTLLRSKSNRNAFKLIILFMVVIALWCNRVNGQHDDHDDEPEDDHHGEPEDDHHDEPDHPESEDAEEDGHHGHHSEPVDLVDEQGAPNLNALRHEFHFLINATVDYYLYESSWFGSFDMKHHSILDGKNTYGSENCKCVSVHINDTLLDLPHEYDHHLPHGYGIHCATHDITQPDCTTLSRDPHCSREWCYVDHEQCELEFEASMLVTGLFYSYAACGHVNVEGMAHVDISGHTLRVMLATEKSGHGLGGGHGWLSGFCDSAPIDYPVGCQGFSMEILSNVQMIGEFHIQYTQVLPDSFWTGITQLCSMQPGLSVCGGSKWTICVYAAGMGYVDFCPMQTSPTRERTAVSSGIIGNRDTLKLYAMAEKPVPLSALAFKFFTVWSPALWFTTAVFVFLGAFTVRFLCGFYTNFSHLPQDYFNEMIDLIWFGFGLFLDLLYPQKLPDFSAKIVLLIFEFVQVVLIASITASLASMMVLERTVTINSLTDVVQYEVTTCFSYSVVMEKFSEFNPTFPTHKLGQEFDGAIANYDEYADAGCGAVVENRDYVAIARSQGQFCMYTDLEVVAAYDFFLPTSRKYHHAISHIAGQYRGSGQWFVDFARIVRSASSDGKCDDAQPKFKGLDVTFFAGLFSIFAVVAAICWAARLLGLSNPDVITVNSMVGLGRHVYSKDEISYKYEHLLHETTRDTRDNDLEKSTSETTY